MGKFSWVCKQSAECEAVYTWILDQIWEELVAAAWKTRRLLGGLVSTSWDLPWVFLPEYGSGLARVWIGSWGILQNFLLALYLAVTRKALQPGTLHVISCIYLWIKNYNFASDLALFLLVLVFLLCGCFSLHHWRRCLDEIIMFD